MTDKKEINRMTLIEASNVCDLMRDMVNSQGHIDHPPGVIGAIILEKLGLTVNNPAISNLAKGKGWTMKGCAAAMKDDADNKRMDKLEARIVAIEERLGVDPLS